MRGDVGSLQHCKSHKESTMTAAMTPSRQQHQHHDPNADIDIKPPHDNLNITLTYEGWLTPPQSAHDSRRPSLTCSAYSGSPAVGLSSDTGYSQPVTPNHDRFHNANESFSQSWSMDAGSHNMTTTEMNNSCGPSQLSDDTLRPYNQDSFANNTALSFHQPTFMPVTPTHNNNSSNAFGIQTGQDQADLSAWSHASHTANPFSVLNNGLPSSFSVSGHDMSTNSLADTSFYHHHDDNMASGELGLPTGMLSDGNVGKVEHATASFYQPPQVVVPSQLSPVEDFQMTDYPDYATPGQSSDSFATSFDSISSGYSHFDVVETPSPAGTYFSSPNHKDHQMIKMEDMHTPSICHLDLATTSLRARRRTSKRRPKPNVRRYTFDNFNAEVVLEGDSFRRDDDGFMRPKCSSAVSKPHACAFVHSNGEKCTARFERSEHLKRHEGSHSALRNFPCPLPDCKREIQRGDNAGDHFKTHLKGPRKGQRNKHYEYPLLRSLLLQTYSKATAAKTIRNLEKWIATNSDAREQRHWLD